MACFDMMKFCPHCGGQFAEVISNAREKVVCGGCGCTWMNNESRIASLESALTTARIDGARAFSEWCDQFEAQGVCYEVKDQLARWLASESKEG